MFELMVEDNFSAAHQLKGYQGACEKLHGHTFKVQLFLSGEKLKPEGFVADFKEIKQNLKEALAEFDHSFLNDLPYFKEINPTSENLAKLIFEKMRKVYGNTAKVTVWESPTSAASYLA